MGTIIVIVIVAAVIAAAIRGAVKASRHGGCPGCSSGKDCPHCKK
ncbi:hypothetical protein FACS189499_02250 [Clostridia bacterium]|nr:hypothetical protein FACS189499_02250 [Clostridia bacterium]